MNCELNKCVVTFIVLPFLNITKKKYTVVCGIALSVFPHWAG
jgi:hypothetical protein